MSPSEASSKSRMIGRKLLNEIDWGCYKSVCTFTPIDELNEIDILPVISRLEAQGLSVYKIPPSKESQVPSEKFDIILVPCLAFDDGRQRLGWGGGWYDRFLAGQSKALKIGVAYQASLIGGIPHEPHDIRLDKIITEERIY